MSWALKVASDSETERTGAAGSTAKTRGNPLPPFTLAASKPNVSLYQPLTFCSSFSAAHAALRFFFLLFCKADDFINYIFTDSVPSPSSTNFFTKTASFFHHTAPEIANIA